MTPAGQPLGVPASSELDARVRSAGTGEARGFDATGRATDGAEQEAAISRDLRGYVMHGLRWSAALVIATQVARTVTSLVLVRLLSPQDYGLAGMALLFSSLVLAFSDLGLGSGLVQRATITETDRSTVFWTSIMVGLLLTGAGVAAASPLASFFHEPRVRPLFMVVSLSFVLLALQTTQAALFQRAMRFRAITIRRVVSTLGGAVVGIVVALAGGGAWALILQAVSVTLLSTILIWSLSSWSPRFTYSLTSLRTMGGFGINVLGSRILDYTQGNADNILVGRYLGSSALGVYSVAYNVILLPAQRVLSPLQEAFYPAFSRIQDDPKRLARLWLRVSRVVAALIAPAMFGIIAVAPDFVRVVLGERWLACVPIVRILAVVTLLQGFTAVAQRALLALGRADLVLRNSILRTALAIAAFGAGLHWGIVGVAAFYTAVSIPAQAYLVNLVTRELSIGKVRYLSNLNGITQAALFMFGCCLISRWFLVHTSLTPSLRLLSVIGIGVAAYVPMLNWRCPGVTLEIKNIRKKPIDDATTLDNATLVKPAATA